MARQIRRTPSQVALSWIRQRKGVIIPILGVRTHEQLRDNLGCLEVSLDMKQMDRLDGVSAIEMGFPYDFLAMDMAKRAVITSYSIHYTKLYDEQVEAPLEQGEGGDRQRNLSVVPAGHRFQSVDRNHHRRPCCRRERRMLTPRATPIRTAPVITSYSIHYTKLYEGKVVSE